jgi:hypothetical protein
MQKTSQGVMDHELNSVGLRDKLQYFDESRSASVAAQSEAWTPIAWTLWSWVRIPVKTWIFVLVY